VGVSRCFACVEGGGRNYGGGQINQQISNQQINQQMINQQANDRQKAINDFRDFLAEKRKITEAAMQPNRAAQTARRNNATRATFTNHALTHPFAEGGFRWVAKGKYTHGARAGEACVCKWFKTGHVDESSFFDLDIKAMNKAHELVKEWNSKRMVDKLVKVNIPEVWTFEHQIGSPRSGKKVLQEPFITNYQKFNSNNGWADNETPWPRVMQALSHFSYHVSGGQFVLCDLQGGVYADSVVLTDPVILSRTKMYGVTDLGPLGISSFFSNHRCNEFCNAGWMKPADQRRYFQPQAGTSMVGGGGGTNANQHVPTYRLGGVRASRASAFNLQFGGIGEN